MKLKHLVLMICILGTGVLLTACKMTPRPLTTQERYQRSEEMVQKMFANQPPLCGKLTLNQAIARGLQFNLDYRIKQANSAIKAGQMQVAEFAMFPEISASASVYNRNNDNSSYSSNPNGTPSNIVLNGSDRKLRSARAGVKWNVLNFWTGYLNARMEGERLLIAEEESRQQFQKLIQDIRVTYFKAYQAQEMSKEIKLFHRSLEKAKNLVEKATHDENIPREKILNYQKSLLGAHRRLIELEANLEKSVRQFRLMINFPIHESLTLEKPPTKLTKIENLSNLDFEKLDAITLVNRSELKGQDYQRRIAALGVNAAVVQVFPEIVFSKSKNYNSNSFVVNHTWRDHSTDANWNLLNVTALPWSLKRAKAEKKYETLKLMSLTVSALNETRLFVDDYQRIAKACQIAHQQTINAQRLHELFKKEESAKVASQQEVVMAELELLNAKMNEKLLLSDLLSALSNLYLSVGFDILPLELSESNADAILSAIQKSFSVQENVNFKEYVGCTYKRLFNEVKCVSN